MPNVIRDLSPSVLAHGSCPDQRLQGQTYSSLIPGSSPLGEGKHSSLKDFPQKVQGLRLAPVWDSRLWIDQPVSVF